MSEQMRKGAHTMAGRDWRLIARRLQALWPLGVTLAVVVGAVLLLGSGGAGARSGATPSSAAQTASGAAKAPLQIARADAHAEYVQQGRDVEVNLALTQTQNDCQAPLNGGVCLRYSVVIDEEASLVGYGVIPAAAVTVSAGAITLHVDTGKTPGFIHVVGGSVLIVATWKSAATATAAAAAAKAGAQQQATAQGTIGTYTLPSVAASGTASSGASMIATMIVR